MSNGGRRAGDSLSFTWLVGKWLAALSRPLLHWAGMDIGIAFMTGSAGLLADRVQAMREIWTAEVAEYHGEFTDFGPMWSWPKPAQRPHPPVLVGGNGPGTEDRVLAFGDGWFPQCGWLADVEELRRRAASLRQRAADEGRGPVPVTVFGVPPDRTLIDQLATAGADRGLLALQDDATADQTLTTLDEWARLIPQ